MPNRQRCGIAGYSRNLYAEAESNKNIQLFPFDTKLKDLFSLIFKPVDIVHFQHEFGIWPIMGLFFLIYLIKFRLLNIFTNKKVVVTMHTIWELEKVEINFSHYHSFLQKIIRLYLKLSYFVILKFSDKVIALSQKGVDLLTKYGGDKNKVEYLELGLYKVESIQADFDILEKKYNLKENNKLITMFGFAYPNKGFHLAIKAMPDILKKIPEAVLIVAGSSPAGGGQGYMEELVDLASSLKIQKHVIFTGFLEDEDLALHAIFNYASCFVYPYYERSSASASIGTIFARNKPILVSDIAFFKEYDFLPKFKEGDVADLTLQLVKLLSVSSGEPSYQKNILEMQSYYNQHSITQVFNKQYNIFLNLIYDSNS
jgi:glycosyltransferase involved in cell wall biosynthesis